MLNKFFQVRIQIRWHYKALLGVVQVQSNHERTVLPCIIHSMKCIHKNTSQCHFSGHDKVLSVLQEVSSVQLASCHHVHLHKYNYREMFISIVPIGIASFDSHDMNEKNCHFGFKPLRRPSVEYSLCMITAESFADRNSPRATIDLP